MPGGAFYAWPNVTEACRITGCADSEVFRKRLLTEAGVAVLADIHFGRRVPGDGQHIRFSYAASPRRDRRGRAAPRRVRAPAHVGRPMPTSLANNQAARDAVLGRVRASARQERIARRRARDAEAYIAAHAHGPRPAMPADLVGRFIGARHGHGEHASSGSPTARAFRRRSRATSTRSTCRRRSPRRSRARASAGRNSRISTGKRRASRSKRGRRRARIASASPARSARSPRPARSWC